MARTFQTTRVVKELTVADNLLAGAHTQIKFGTLSFILGDRRAWNALAEAEEVAWAIARLLDIDRYWNERTASLEFSARRRVEIGRAILAGPRLLLLDEPAAGLDPASSAALFTLIRQLHSDLGLTVLLVEHYVKAVLDTCDLVHVLAQGTVLASGTPAEIAEHPEVREHYLGTRISYLDKLSGGLGGSRGAAAMTPEEARAAWGPPAAPENGSPAGPRAGRAAASAAEPAAEAPAGPRKTAYRPVSRVGRGQDPRKGDE
jgi:ABC-type lipopolysaccharide export system ATPase subunit